jgi:hypothetical protein
MKHVSKHFPVGLLATVFLATTHVTRADTENVSFSYETIPMSNDTPVSATLGYIPMFDSHLGDLTSISITLTTYYVNSELIIGFPQNPALPPGYTDVYGFDGFAYTGESLLLPGGVGATQYAYSYDYPFYNEDPYWSPGDYFGADPTPEWVTAIGGSAYVNNFDVPTSALASYEAPGGGDFDFSYSVFNSNISGAVYSLSDESGYVFGEPIGTTSGNPISSFSDLQIWTGLNIAYNYGPDLETKSPGDGSAVPDSKSAWKLEMVAFALLFYATKSSSAEKEPASHAPAFS